MTDFAAKKTKRPVSSLSSGFAFLSYLQMTGAYTKKEIMMIDTVQVRSSQSCVDALAATSLSVMYMACAACCQIGR